MAKGPGCHSGVGNGTKTPNRVGAELGVAREGKMTKEARKNVSVAVGCGGMKWD